MKRRSSSVLFATLLDLVAGCGAPLANTSRPARVSRPRTTHAALTRGWLSARDGQLLFWPKPGAPFDRSERPARPTGGADRSSGTPGLRAVILPQLREHHYSPLLPHVLPGQILAVRTTLPSGARESSDGRDELVQLDGRNLRADVLWSPGRRLLLLGRSSHFAVLLTYDGTRFRVTAFDLESGRSRDSEPVDIDASAFNVEHALFREHRLDPEDGGPEQSGLYDATTYLLPCRGGVVCQARVGSSGVNIERADVPSLAAPSVIHFRFSEVLRGPIRLEERHGPMDTREIGCLLPTQEPLGVWVRRGTQPCPTSPMESGANGQNGDANEDSEDGVLPPRLGPPTSRWDVGRGLPVDGVQVFGVSVDVEESRVRTSFTVPGRRVTERCSIDLREPDRALPANEGRPFRRVVVPSGCTVTLSLDDLAFVLSRERLVVTRHRDGQVYEICLPPPDAAFEHNDCRQGTLSLAASASGAEPNRIEMDFEYGYCD